MIVGFLGPFINGRYHTACMYTGPVVWNAASVTLLFYLFFFKDVLLRSSMGFLFSVMQFLTITRGIWSYFP